MPGQAKRERRPILDATAAAAKTMITAREKLRGIAREEGALPKEKFHSIAAAATTAAAALASTAAATANGSLRRAVRGRKQGRNANLF